MTATHSTKESAYVQEKKHAPAFTARVALNALSGEKTVAKRSAGFGVHQTLIHKWVKQLKESAAGIFAGEIKAEEARRKTNSRYFMSKSASLLWNTIFQGIATLKCFN